MKLEEIIGQFLNSADQTTHQFIRLWNIAVFGIKSEFNLDIIGVYRTKILDVNCNNTVDFPCDYIKYRKIGLINGAGEVQTFKRNDQLTTLESRLCEPPTSGGSSALYPYGNEYVNFWGRGSMWNLYGSDSGTVTIGEYTIDEKSRQIFLSPNSNHTQIVMEYLCDGLDCECGVIDIDVRAAASMLAYIRWQDAVDKPKKFNANQVMMYMRNFYRTKRLAKMRLNPFILNEMQHAMRVGTKLVAHS